jgi:hypothetical protein
MILDVALAKVETEKRGSLIKAWEENEKAKAENKYVINIISFCSPIGIHLFVLLVLFSKLNVSLVSPRKCNYIT